QLSSDGKYLIAFNSDNCYYRDNTTNVWYRIRYTMSFGADLAVNQIVYFDYSDSKTYRFNLDTQEKTLVLENVINNKHVYEMFFFGLTGGRNSLVALIRLRE
ncbi:MAG: hypothetical protein PHO32_08405, partial [Candidatus Cloacimonetes bacterium]|nr:hypothetical protein [Candidatus Cloacimonadota bacterium]